MPGKVESRSGDTMVVREEYKEYEHSICEVWYLKNFSEWISWLVVTEMLNFNTLFKEVEELYYLLSKENCH